jgi:hypothetical protein
VPLQAVVELQADAGPAIADDDDVALLRADDRLWLRSKPQSL